MDLKNLLLNEFIALIDKDNIASTALALLFNFIQMEQYIDSQNNKIINKWRFTKEMFDQNLHLIAFNKFDKRRKYLVRHTSPFFVT